MTEILAHPREDHSAHSCLGEDLVDEGTVLGGELGERRGELVRDGKLRRQRRREMVLEGIGIKRLARDRGDRRGRGTESDVIPGEGGDRQPELVGERADAIRAFVGFGVLSFSVQ